MLPVQTDDDITHDYAEKSEIFNDYFCDQSDINDDYLIPPDLDGPLYEQLRQIIITETDVDDILKTLDTSKATGPDMLNPILLKEASSILKYPLCKLFNLSLSTSIFPTEWKFANITPVLKKDPPCNVKNYRLISLISIIGKIMERCVYKYIHNYLLPNSIITPHQSGFTRGDSAINQLLFITNQ
jgi:hypothetical protein